MLRTLFTVGVMALVGLVLLKIAFGILGGVFALFLGLLFVALKILLVGGLAYVVLLVVSPGTAKRLRDWINGTPSY